MNAPNWLLGLGRHPRHPGGPVLRRYPGEHRVSEFVVTTTEPGLFGLILTLLARVTGRVWFWYSVEWSSRRRLYFGRG